jgi:hypothetical protein
VITDGVLDNGFMDYLQAVTTNNYNTIADFHTLHITTTYTKSFPVCSVFIRRFRVTASNNGYSSASGLKSSLNGGSLPTELFLGLSFMLRPVLLHACPLQRERVYLAVA